MISMCGDSCCREKTDGSNNIMCGWFVGYAQPGKPKPCGRYENAIRAANDPTIPSEDMTKWMNVGIDKAISDTRVIRSSPEAGSLRDCQAKCTAREHCNTVNWHERNTMCKQYMCLRQVGMGTREILGYEILHVDHDKSERSLRQGELPCFTFHVGAWGECLNMPNFTSDWRFTPPTKWSDCELVKSRPVVCKGSDGKTYPDSFCMRRWRKATTDINLLWFLRIQQNVRRTRVAQSQKGFAV